MRTKIFLITIAGILMFSNCKKEDNSDHGFLYIPTVFTPNDDFLNDNFSPTGFYIDSTSMVITNTDGQILYNNAFNIKSGWICWNGKNAEGKTYPRGMYFYNIYVRYLDGVEERHIGTIELSLPGW
ncbi:MAG: gliding motility-associated C-terminal domain-containing protein [Bacteroidales bacterium]|nr:gliding motility-associated C-terminal domain-containing protein [Bacteroidales bacterium]